jgi:hypothetical protein
MTMKKLWQFLNGNKTIICLFLLSLISQPFITGHLDPSFLEYLKWILTALSGGSLFDHLRKGYFSTAVGNPGQKTGG